MSEISFDFPNSYAQKQAADIPNPWSFLSGKEFVKAAEAPESEEIKALKMAVIAKKDTYQTLATNLCADSEGCLTSSKAFIAQDAYATKRNPAIGEAYAELAEAQAKLIEEQDKENDNPVRKAAKEYADSINPINYEFSVSHEVVAVSTALGQLHDIAERKKNREGAFEKIGGWIQDYCDTRDATNVLKKYGYEESGAQSGIFALILQEAKAIRYGVPTKDSHIDGALGRKRICDFMELDAVLSDERTGHSCRRALAEKGYKSTPTSWKDQDFSTCDIAEMCAIARKCEQ